MKELIFYNSDGRSGGLGSGTLRIEDHSPPTKWRPRIIRSNVDGVTIRPLLGETPQSETIIIEPGDSITIGDVIYKREPNGDLIVKRPTGFNGEISETRVPSGNGFGTNRWEKNARGNVVSIRVDIQ